MKCSNCGAEISNTKFCEFCGSQITADMQKEQEQLNKIGCPKCGSTNIKFAREKLGEERGKKGTQIIRTTTGVCNDCGYTWQTQVVPKKKKTWLWVLGWIFVFPVPLTIILLRKKDLNKILKYGIIAVAWIVYLVIGFSGGVNNADSNNTVTEPNSLTSTVSNAENVESTNKEPETTQVKNVIEITDGKIGEYGKEITMSAGTDLEEILIVYYVPAGKYTVRNLGEYPVGINVYEGFEKNEETGYDEYTDAKDTVRLEVNGEDEIEVPEGWFIEIHGAHILLTEK